MSVPEYVNWIPLPPPVTSGVTVQSYVDPTGDTWVAKNGVFSGQWRRASQYLKARAHRATTITAGVVGFNQMPYDAIDNDPYGMIGSSVPAIASIPLAGWWDIRAGFQQSSAIAGRSVGTVYRNGAEILRGNDNFMAAAGTGVPSSVCSDIVQLTAGDTVSPEIYVSTSMTFNAGIGQTFFSIAWRSP